MNNYKTFHTCFIPSKGFFPACTLGKFSFVRNEMRCLRLLCSVLERPAPFATSYIVNRENKTRNNGTMFPALKDNAAAGYQGPVKIELLRLLKGAGLLGSTELYDCKIRIIIF